jgi:hypothetical protein
MIRTTSCLSPPIMSTRLACTIAVNCGSLEFHLRDSTPAVAYHTVFRANSHGVALST